MEAPDHVGRVVLVGFMAAGKTTVGRRLAELLGWEFVDFDHLIEERTGRAIPDIFADAGEPRFRELEAELTTEYGCASQVVLSPGGGWITQPELLERLCPDSLLVWLRLSPEEAVRRAMRDDTHRPLLAGPDPLAKARLLMAEREPLYRLADVIVPVDDRDAEQIAWEIAGMVR